MNRDAQLQRLMDQDTITDLIHAYCYHFDRNEPDAVAALFSEDAVVDYGPEAADLVGVEAIRTAVARGLRETFAATSHHVSNVRITFDGADAARSVCYLYAWHRYHGGAPDGELWAQYHHDFVRTADGWRISKLVLKAAGMTHFHRARMHPIGRQ
jgi:ketosteroid isomerase-like protein